MFRLNGWGIDCLFLLKENGIVMKPNYHKRMMYCYKYNIGGNTNQGIEELIKDQFQAEKNEHQKHSLLQLISKREKKIVSIFQSKNTKTQNDYKED